MAKTIALIGALDTKGAEFAFVRDAIQARGHKTVVVDVGVMGEPTFPPDVTAAAVAAAAGATLADLRAGGDRGAAVARMAEGAAHVVRSLYDQGRLDGILGMGGSAGTCGSSSGPKPAAMRMCPSPT